MINYNDFEKVDIRVGKVLKVEDFPPKQIGPFMSEVLIVGVANEEDQVALVRPDKPAKIGSRLF